jgi:F-type H+-transporting ATPase subunit epsilon
MPDHAVAGQLKCQVVTPEKLVVDHPAEFIIITSHDGQIGVMPEHSAYLGRLAPGMLRIDVDKKQELYFVEGGFAEIIDNQVTILTPQAIPADKLDPQAIDDELRQAEQLPTAIQEDIEKKSVALAVARGKRSVYLAHQGVKTH